MTDQIPPWFRIITDAHEFPNPVSPLALILVFSYSGGEEFFIIERVAVCAMALP